MQISYMSHAPQVHESAFVAPTATLVGNVILGPNSSVWFASVLRADINSIIVGAESNIQDGCLLHVTNEHAVNIGLRVTCGHGAIIHGCTIEDDCLIAMGAIVLDGAVIGRGSIVGAGAVVAPGSIIPPKSLVLGMPGKVIRAIGQADSEKIQTGWQSYCKYKDIYREQQSQSH